MKKTYEIKRWIQGKSEHTLQGYQVAMKLYLQYIEERERRKLTPKQLIDEIEADRKKPARYGREVERRIKDWHRWLTTEPISKNGEPYSLSTAQTRVGSIMGFYRANGYRIFFTERFSDLFPTRTKYKKRLLSTGDVAVMVDCAKTLRDNAIILFLFEGGFDESTLCSLNIGHVREQLENARAYFLTIEAYRAKEKWEYITHVGEWGVKALRAYLKERKGKGHHLTDESPLFVKEWARSGADRRIRPRLIQEMMRDVASRAGLINLADIPKNAMSPVRPHAFRMAFKTLLETAMKRETAPYVEAWLGHKTKYQGAYFKPNPLLSLNVYKSVYYEALAIRRPSRDIMEFEKRIKILEENNRALLEAKAALELKLSRLREEITEDVNNRIEEAMKVVKDMDEAIKTIKLLQDERLKRGPS